MTVAMDYDIKITFHIEPYKGRSALSVKSDIIYIITKYSLSHPLTSSHSYGKHPSFYRYQGKPFFYIYDSYHIQPQEWATVFQPYGSQTVCVVRLLAMRRFVIQSTILLY